MLEDLRRRGLLVRQRIVRVAELVDEVSALLLGDAHAEVLVVLRVPLADVGPGEYHFGAHGAQVEYLFLAHLVGQHENELVAFLRSNQRKTDARIACRRFNERVAR